VKILHLDCVAGIAGDMLLGALLDVGASRSALDDVVTQLELGLVELRIERVERHGIRALAVTVTSDDVAETRRYPQIVDLIESGSLDPEVRSRSLETFRRLGEAEASIHGTDLDDVHFHELGAVDTLVDVCGAMALLADLGVEKITSTALPYSTGLIRSAHGMLPVPAPATLRLLEDVPLVGCEIQAELVTPTGAALAATLVSEWGAPPPFVLERAGYGAGARDLSERPNVVRAVVGTSTASRVAEVVQLETNLDDLNPELLPDAVERCYAAGALDVWTVPAQMKKGRPGFVLAALARPEDEAAIVEAILEETTALGVRSARLPRYELQREERTVPVYGGLVRVKLGRLDGRVLNVAPEHDDCAALARATGKPVKSIWAAAVAAAHEP
jgi:pyridinium-3,5-bisthiocarboxylic acid mononucleotide nickel chelatase